MAAASPPMERRESASSMRRLMLRRTPAYILSRCLHCGLNSANAVNFGGPDQRQRRFDVVWAAANAAPRCPNVSQIAFQNAEQIRITGNIMANSPSDVTLRLAAAINPDSPGGDATLPCNLQMGVLAQRFVPAQFDAPTRYSPNYVDASPGGADTDGEHLTNLRAVGPRKCGRDRHHVASAA